MPFNYTLTLGNGDIYQIDGTFSNSNNGDGTYVLANEVVQVTYEGNGMGGASAADTVTVKSFNAYQTVLDSGTFGAFLYGTCDSTIAAGSSASTCVNDVLGCLGPASSPGVFDFSTSFDMNSNSGVFNYDPSFISNFAAGSPVGSFVLFGATTPEPGSLSLIAGGLAIAIFRSRRPRVS
jgi:hypothetical protein